MHALVSSVQASLPRGGRRTTRGRSQGESLGTGYVTTMAQQQTIKKLRTHGAVYKAAAIHSVSQR